MKTINLEKQFVLYYRVSTERQDLDTQKRILRNHLQEEWIDREYEEIVSGKTMRTNPQLNEAVEYCKKTGKTLAAAKHDRIGRDLAHAAKIAGELNYNMFLPNIVSVGQKINPAIFGMMMGMAQLEREWISERTKEGLATAIAKGKKLGPKKPLSPRKRAKASKQVSETRARAKFSDPGYIKVRDFVVSRINEYVEEGNKINHQHRRQGGDIYEKVAIELNKLGMKRPEYLGKLAEKEFKAKYIAYIYQSETRQIQVCY